MFNAEFMGMQFGMSVPYVQNVFSPSLNEGHGHVAPPWANGTTSGELVELRKARSRRKRSC